MLQTFLTVILILVMVVVYIGAVLLLTGAALMFLDKKVNRGVIAWTSWKAKK